jgi:hypothetical protein
MSYAESRDLITARLDEVSTIPLMASLILSTPCGASNSALISS